MDGLVGEIWVSGRNGNAIEEALKRRMAKNTSYNLVS